MSLKMAVTGGAGFIGSNLVRRLAEENEVLVIDDLSAGKMENLAGVDAQIIVGTIADLEMLKSAFQDVDCIFHLAAIASVQKSIDDPLETNKTNLGGTLNVLLAARDAGARRMIFASSAAVYGDTLQLPKREDMVPQPKSPYAITKLAGEHYCRVFHEIYGLETASLRFFNVFGPWQDPNSEYSGVISKFISAVRSGRNPLVFGDGTQTRDFVFVDDVVRACILACRGKVGGPCNIARGQSTSLNQLLQMIGNATGDDIRPIYAAPRPGDIMHSLADISLARSIGYKPEFSIEDGLKKTMDWMYEQII
jgi:nucleoside-diphosphate-sugar epimerase